MHFTALLVLLAPITLASPLPQGPILGPAGKVDCNYYFQAESLQNRNLIEVNVLFDCLSWGGSSVAGQYAVANEKANAADGTTNNWQSSCRETSHEVGTFNWAQKNAIGGNAIVTCA